MKRSKVKLGIILLSIVIGVVFFNKYVLRSNILFYPKFFINLENYLFVKAEKLKGFVEKVEHFNRLASENDELNKNKGMLLSLKVKNDDLENENDFLRHAARISQRVNRAVIYAGIFNLSFAPTGYNVLLNKGEEDGVSEGDIVVTSENVLVGIVQKVMQNFSRILFISDPEFKITAKVMSSSTAGIARGALNEGMNLDMILQEDQIKEGDILISVGNDMFPPALIIGSVGHVEASATQIFKKVRIHPAVKEAQLGRVLVIKMK